jgi:hypothetical protein
MQQQSHEGLGAFASIALLNQAYQLKGGAMMSESPSNVLARMNTAFNAIYGTMSRETRMRAGKTFYSCQDWLLERGIRFHQTIDGRWVLDEKKEKKEY